MPGAIGETLRSERLARGIELAEVEERTKIRIRYLRALEAEDWQTLPGDAYTRGFLRTYGDFLGLDGLALVEEYRRLAPAPEPIERPEPLLEARRPRYRGGGLRLGGGTVALLAVVGVLGVLLVLGLTGGSDEGGGNRTSAGRSAPPTRTTATTTTTTTTPSRVEVRLAATGEVWVCLVDQNGEPVAPGVDSQILAAGDEEGPFEAKEMKLALGNGAMRLEVNGQDVRVPASPNPLGYDLKPTGVRELDATAIPTCS